jgi:CheY-like chemotaxis protein
MYKILVISSDKDFLNGVKSDAHFWDSIVQTCDNTDDTFEQINSFGPDLVIIDFILNDSNGGAICHQIKTNAETHLLPVILVSEYSGIYRFTTKFGCNVLLQKPLDSYTLYSSVLHLLDPSHFAAEA